MCFTDEYRAISRKMKKGGYGEVWGKWAGWREDAVIDINKGVYICPACGNWSNEPALDVYYPISDADTGKESQKAPSASRRKTLVDIPLTPSETPWLRLAAKYEHVCERCNAVMYRVEPSPPTDKFGWPNEITLPPLKCPECGRILEVTDHMHWG
jgi:rubrerythrin